MGAIIINSEECRQILDFAKYHISESGRIYRTLPNSNFEKEKIENGALFINESKIHFKVSKGELKQGFASLTDTKGTLHNIAVAPLVAIAFGVIPKMINKKKKEVSYKDGNKKNLHHTNLFVTKRRFPNSKLKSEAVKHIKKQIKKGIPLKKIAQAFSVSEMQISRIKTGENWGNGKRKIKAPIAPFKIEDGGMRKYIATFDKKKTVNSIKKRFIVKRNANKPSDNLIVGIINGHKLTLKHTNITRAKQSVEKLNEYFFN